MKYFDFEICGLKRKLPYVKVADNLALASFVCLSDTELVMACAPELVKRLPEVDVLMTAEAKGICLTYEMSRLMGMKEFVVARKSKKPYMQNAISFKACSVTTQKEQTLWLDGVEAEKIRGKRVGREPRGDREPREGGGRERRRPRGDSGGARSRRPQGHHLSQGTLRLPSERGRDLHADQELEGLRSAGRRKRDGGVDSGAAGAYASNQAYPAQDPLPEQAVDCTRRGLLLSASGSMPGSLS